MLYPLRKLSCMQKTFLQQSLFINFYCCNSIEKYNYMKWKIRLNKINTFCICTTITIFSISINNIITAFAYVSGIFKFIAITTSSTSWGSAWRCTQKVWTWLNIANEINKLSKLIKVYVMYQNIMLSRVKCYF